MRHLREIGQERLAVDIASDGNFHGSLRCLSFWGAENVTDRNDLALFVWYFDTNGLLARDRSDDANVFGGHCIRDVVGEVLDLCDLNAKAEFELEPRHGWTDHHVDEPSLYAVFGERPLKSAASRNYSVLVDILRSGAAEHRHWG